MLSGGILIYLVCDDHTEFNDCSVNSGSLLACIEGASTRLQSLTWGLRETLGQASQRGHGLPSITDIHLY